MDVSLKIPKIRLTRCRNEDTGGVTPPPPEATEDLVGLTQSVAMVTAEHVGMADSTQLMSLSQGRVAMVIRPRLTQGMLKHIADKTDFFRVTR
ncbi:hypothetical protein AMELA_G00292800 [Ameiurus melas]|uniref:Uncharacterized protein n=1 Tax=Ameiurus melas TaxID=219545 RepID=A0A7J5ZHY5_AMEME|nr:hypothetical protein AMELA_G00292800 [Ameiurus melas]